METLSSCHSNNPTSSRHKVGLPSIHSMTTDPTHRGTHGQKCEGVCLFGAGHLRLSPAASCWTCRAVGRCPWPCPLPCRCPCLQPLALRHAPHQEVRDLGVGGHRPHCGVHRLVRVHRPKHQGETHQGRPRLDDLAALLCCGLGKWRLHWGRKGVDDLVGHAVQLGPGVRPGDGSLAGGGRGQAAAAAAAAASLRHWRRRC